MRFRAPFQMTSLQLENRRSLKFKKSKASPKVSANNFIPKIKRFLKLKNHAVKPGPYTCVSKLSMEILYIYV